MSGDLEARLAALEQRLTAAEDELAIHRLIVRYGLAVDVGDADSAAAVFTEVQSLMASHRVWERFPSALA